MATRMTMIVMTTSNSMSVNPVPRDRLRTGHIPVIAFMDWFNV
jgi:hypothetical protein